MKEQLIEYKTAVLAREKGFEGDYIHFYTKPKSKMYGLDEHSYTDVSGVDYSNFDQALEAGLYESLKLIKNENSKNN